MRRSPNGNMGRQSMRNSKSRGSGRVQTRSTPNNPNQLVRGQRFSGNPVTRYSSPNGINRFGGTRTTTKAKKRRAAVNRDTGNQMKKNIPNNFRGREDKFWSKIVKGIRKFLQSPFT